MNRKFIPAIDEDSGQPFNFIKSALLTAESMKSIRMDKPADFKNPLYVAEGRKVSRIVII